MLRNYLTIAIRNLLRNKTYSFINIVGLAVGMATFLLIAFFTIYEFSYDRFHSNADRIYRILLEYNILSEGATSAIVPGFVGPKMQQELPQINNFVRIAPPGEEYSVIVGSQIYHETTLMSAEQSFFEIFTVEPIVGNLSTALVVPGSIVLTEKAALKYFSSVDVLGEILEVGRGDGRQSYQVTAVIEDLPPASHLDVDLITYHVVSEELGLGGSSVVTYVLLNDQAAVADVEQGLPGFVNRYFARNNPTAEEEAGSDSEPSLRFMLRLQPLKDIHLNSDFIGIDSAVLRIGPRQYLYIFFLVAVVILLVACTNYINISITRALRRIEEVGIRKTIGANRSQIIGQFLCESAIIGSLATTLALVLVQFALPTFNAAVGVDLSLGFLAAPYRIVQLAGFAILIVFVTGGYPAYLLSKPAPNQILNKALFTGIKGEHLRKALIIFQFSASIALTMATLTIARQMHYTRTSRLNVDGSATVLIKNLERTINENYPAFKNALRAQSSIVNVTTGTLPGTPGNLTLYTEDNGELVFVDIVFGDLDYLSVLGLELIEGRGFESSDQYDPMEVINRIQSARAAADPSSPEDIRRIYEQFAPPVIVNETALAWLGIEDPIGQVVQEFSLGRIIGVVKDFHVQSLHQVINPTVIRLSPSVNSILVQLQKDKIPAGLAAIESIWKEFSPGIPISYTFLDDEMDKDYQAEIKMATILGWFTVLTVFISCLGLFGLAAFAAERRTKEIGIRKVVGASVTQVVTLLSKEFLVLVLIANVIAWPVAWYAMHRWLENFAYRIELSWWLFVLAGLLALLIALATVSWQTIRAATANPVDSLRYE